MKKTISVMSIIFLSMGINPLIGQIYLPDIFTDHMILQRNEPVHFWGKGLPGMEVKVLFSSERKVTVVKADSTWSVFFKEQPASSIPRSVHIQVDTNRKELKNILIGDVWLCIGQSNMEWPMEKEKYFEEEVKQVNQPLLRFYNAGYAGKNIYAQSYTDSVLQRLNNKDFYRGNWQESDSNSIKQMSAVGYYFGKEIALKEKVPIGLINLAIGGCPIETFISTEIMKKSKQFFTKVKGNWLTNDALPVWIRERGQQNVGEVSVIHQDELGPNHAYKPGFAYVSGIEPLVKMPIKGAIWYQGESNAQEPERVNEYSDLLKLMIEDYRYKWNQPKMPFYWVQLSSIDTSYYKSHYWPEFRNKQRQLLNRIRYGGMAVCSDIGLKNDVHPTNKKEVGMRLARWALNKSYGKNLVPSGPLPVRAIYKNGKVVVNFKYVAKELKTANNEKLKGFSVDGATEMGATIEGKKIIIEAIEKPDYVYYGWKPFTDANLINSEFLPASTFKLKVK